MYVYVTFRNHLTSFELYCVKVHNATLILKKLGKILAEPNFTDFF